MVFITDRGFLLVLFLLLSTLAYSQKSKSKQVLQVTYYNVGDFYTPGTDSMLALNGKPHRWDSTRYQYKIHTIPKVISSINDSFGLDILGMYGFQNREVYQDVLRQDFFRKSSLKGVFRPHLKNTYKGLHFALFYNPKKIKLVGDSIIPLRQHSIKELPFHDIHHYRFLTRKGKDTVHILMVHYEASLPGIFPDASSRRILQTIQLNRKLRESGLNTQKQHILMMGSFFEHPTSTLFTALMNVGFPTLESYRNVQWAHMLPSELPMSFATNYQDTTPRFDHVMLVSDYTIKGISNWRIQPESIRVFNPKWMQSPTVRFKNQPFDHFFNEKWLGGYGPYFPISLTYTYEKRKK